ncbi:MAG: hypothetical protein AB7V27_15865 [Candidatus Binatia bacterium]
MTSGLLVASLLALFGPDLVAHVRYAADFWHFSQDAQQQTWPFLRAADPQLFRGDYIADFYLAHFPIGYRFLYELSAPVLDPRLLGKVLPYVELAVVLYALITATWSLAGPAAAWGTGAIALGADIYLSRMGGGLPRSFAFPLAALAVLALVRGKPTMLLVLTVVATAFYYPTALLLGVTTAAYLWALPAPWRGEAETWSLRRRVGAVGAAAAVVMMLALPPWLAGRPFGPPLRPVDAPAYPEMTLGGRYAPADLPTPGALRAVAVERAARPLVVHGRPWIPDLYMVPKDAVKKQLLTGAVAGAVIASYVWLFAVNVGARRLLPLILSAFVLYELSLLASPYLYIPERYIVYSLPLLTPVIVPAAIACAMRRRAHSRAACTAAGAVVVALVALVIVAIGGRGLRHSGIDVAIPPAHRPLYAFLATLPPDALIAGWPDRVLDAVPYASARKILVGYEIHQAMHKRYAEEMRRRMQALITAYFARDPTVLRQLRDEFGVTHLLVNRAHYTRPPTYFAPFGGMIVSAAVSSRGRPAAVRESERAAVFAEGPFIVLDLRRLG